MKKYRLTALKTAGLLVGIAVFIFLVLAWFYGRSLPLETPGNNITKFKRDATSAIDLDSDADGVKDWEETIYHTDPKNPDTDGDAVRDGEEIAKNRDPLKKGPDDINPIAMEQADPIRDAYNRLKDLSSQGNITQALVSQIISQNSIDSFLKPGQSEKTAEELAVYLKKIKSQPQFSENAIPDASLAISDDVSASSIKTYFNAVAKIYEKNILPLKTDDLTILQTALEKEDKTEFGKISPLITAIETTYQEIKNTPTPQNLLLFHKKELFLLKSTREELALVQSASLEDAFYIALLMNMRVTRKKEVSALHNSEIPLWLDSKKIAFSANDKAPMLYQKR